MIDKNFPRFPVDEKLIFDVGMHDGDDTAYYLESGFRVIGVEANPRLIAPLRSRFPAELKAGRLHIIPKAAASKAGRQPFFVNQANDQWSSLKKSFGTRGNKYRMEEVDCVDLISLIGTYGCPYYLKVNTEGSDLDILSVLQHCHTRPPFLSIGVFEPQFPQVLVDFGYTHFCLTAQNDKSWATITSAGREGYVGPRRFTSSQSGPFGRDLTGWATASGARQTFRQAMQISSRKDEWYDIHATYWPRRIGFPQDALVAS